MPVSKEQLGAIIASKAAALCRPELDNSRARGRVNESYGAGGPSPDAYDGDADAWDRMYSDFADEDYAPSSDIQYNEMTAARSSMPAAIKESMMKNKIDTSALGNTTVLDSLGVKGKPMTAPTQRRQVVAEQAMPYAPPTAQAGGNVDYSIIKAIVNECLKEYFGKNPINEGTIKTIGLKGGKISLAANKGNINQADLKKVGNAKDNK